MDAYDRHLVAFVLTWAPFGGPLDEDAFPRFGLSGRALYDRFHRIIAAAHSHMYELDELDEELVRRACELRGLVADQLFCDGIA